MESLREDHLGIQGVTRRTSAADPENSLRYFDSELRETAFCDPARLHKDGEAWAELEKDRLPRAAGPSVRVGDKTFVH